MIAELAPIFEGAYADVGEALVLSDDPRPFVSVAEALEPDRLQGLLGGFSASFDDPDPRATASQWSKWYFSKLIMPALAANLAMDWQVPLSHETTGLVLGDDGRVVAIRLAHAGEAREAANARERFAGLFERHLGPVVKALARAGSLPQKVLWSNAGNIAENVIRLLETRLGATHPAIRQANEMLETRRWPDGAANPLYRPVIYSRAEGGMVRKRRICCLRYFTPSLGTCKTCPLDEAVTGHTNSKDHRNAG